MSAELSIAQLLRTPLDESQRQRLLLDQLRISVMMSRPALVSISVIAVIVAFVQSYWAPPLDAALWCGGVLLASLRSWLTIRAFRAADIKPHQTRSWVRRMTVDAAIFATLWASQIFIFWEPGDPTNHVFLILMLAATMAGGAALSSAATWVSAANLAPYAIGLIVMPPIEGGFINNAMGGLAVLYSLFMASLAHQMHATTRAMLLLREDKSDLIDRLETAKRDSDQARLRAESASRSKSEFLANMSHELRTPLNAILGFSEVLKDEMMGPIGSATYKSYAGDIHTSGQHLLGLINDVLDLSRIEAGQFTIEETDIDLADIAAETVKLVSMRASSAGVRLAVDIETGLGLKGDRRGVKQALLNLLSNAIKFTPAGGQVTVFGYTNNYHGAAFGVRDTGIGIAESDIAHVFENFGQARHDIAVKEKGTGLGLPIVKGICEAHGGSIRLDSRKSRGTIVTLTFPPNRTISERVKQLAVA